MPDGLFWSVKYKSLLCSIKYASLHWPDHVLQRPKALMSIHWQLLFSSMVVALEQLPKISCQNLVRKMLEKINFASLSKSYPFFFFAFIVGNRFSSVVMMV